MKIVTRLFACLGLLSLCFPALAQTKMLTLDDLFGGHPGSRRGGGGFGGGIDWISDDAYLQARPDPATHTVSLMRISAATGAASPFFSASQMEAALAKTPGISPDEAKDASQQRSFSFNSSHTAVLLTLHDDLYYYAFGAITAVHLTHTPGSEQEAQFSPDGKWVSFVRDNNLYVVEIATQQEKKLTTDGDANHLNGRLDWVYQEEVYGRYDFTSYWWSPDSQRIAFLCLDETPVPSFDIVDDIPYPQAVQQQRYPRPGDPNPLVTLKEASVTDGKLTEIDPSKYPADSRLVVRVAWTPDSKHLAYQVQDRVQTWLDVDEADWSGKPQTLLRDTTKAWIEPEEWQFLKDGSFLLPSSRSGWQHLYLYNPQGTLVRALTSGPWDVRTLYGVDEKNGWVYFSGVKDNPLDTDAYRVKLDGSKMERLTQADGSHSVSFSPGFARYTDSWSTITTQPQTALYQSDGKLARSLSPPGANWLDDYALGKPEFVTFKARDGYPLRAILIKPPNFDPTKKYPVMEFTYSGPQIAEVANRWGGSDYLWKQLLAEHGYVIWTIDNRSGSGDGAISAWPVYRNFGASELSDLEDGHAYLKSQPYIDGSRIGRYGWSFGGFMTAYALTHSTDYKMGIGGGTVSDWRDYDSIYTERYMGLPADNPQGYKDSAPRNAADKLHGRLLLIHGAMDDNVHPQNTIQFIYALEQADQTFDLMLYPRSGHGVGDPQLNRHLYQMMTDYIFKYL